MPFLFNPSYFIYIIETNFSRDSKLPFTYMRLLCSLLPLSIVSFLVLVCRGFKKGFVSRTCLLLSNKGVPTLYLCTIGYWFDMGAPQARPTMCDLCDKKLH